ncbi:MAG: hypothetical protein CL609_06785 [Anaerolineaceae bacterium]|nr:hypothetical protein [Anaerolineaceae bacterium]
MIRFRRIMDEWSQDKSLGTVLRNSRFLFSSKSATFIFSNIQGLLTPLILGVGEYGVLGIITTYSMNVNRFFSFRMSDLVVKYAGDAIEETNFERASALIKFAILIETITSVLAFITLWLIAPLAPTVMNNPQIISMIYIFSFALLANFSFESFNSVLRILNKFDQIAKINFAQGFVTAILIVILFFLKGNLLQVLLAYLVGKVVYGLSTSFLGFRAVNQALGSQWWKVSIHRLENKSQLIKFAISTNLSQTMNLIFRDSELLLVGYFTSSVYAGYYKLAIALIGPVMLPIDALNSTVFPEINKAILLKKWDSLKYLLRRTSMIAFGWMTLIFVGVALLGRLFFQIYKNGEYLPTLVILLILIGGYFVANIFFWNRDLLLSFHKPDIPLMVMAVIGIIKTGLLFWLVPIYGVQMQAALLSGYLAVTVSVLALMGIIQIKLHEKKMG